MKYRIKISRDRVCHVWVATPERKKRWFWRWMGARMRETDKYGAVASAMVLIDADKAEQEILSHGKEYFYP